MDVHVRALRYFAAVAEELHFTRAAERLFVSQPGLSKQIRRLEADLRVQLFDRDGQATSLTAAGQALLPHAQALLATWDHAQRAASDAAAHDAATLRVGIQTSVGRGLLPAITKRFGQRRPHWRLELTQVGWDDPTCGLGDGSVDVAFAWLPLPDAAGLRWHVVAAEAPLLALSTSHPLAALQNVSLADLREEPFVALPKEAGALRDHWLAIEYRQGHPPVIGAVAHNADEAFEAVANCLGVVLVAEGNAAMYRRDGIVTMPITGLPASQLALAWRTDDSRDVVRDFVESTMHVSSSDPTERGR